MTIFGRRLRVLQVDASLETYQRTQGIQENVRAKLTSTQLWRDLDWQYNIIFHVQVSLHIMASKQRHSFSL
jgi:hypothetical protein